MAAAIEKEDPTAVLSFRTLDEQIDASLTQERLVATLAGFFGVLGLLLAAVGLYGVTSYAVTSRRAEIGIRMALGASARGVVAMVLRRVAWLVGLGIVLGAGLSVWAATFIKTLLYGLDARDPATFVSAAALLMLVAALAAWLPARRASRIDPMRVSEIVLTATSFHASAGWELGELVGEGAYPRIFVTVATRLMATM